MMANFVEAALSTALERWVARSDGWHLRVEETWQNLGYRLLDGPVPYRLATAEEVAVALADDPRLRWALALLGDPRSEVIETVVARRALPPYQADLLVGALQECARLAADQRRPTADRALAFAGTVAFVAILAVIVRGSTPD